MPRQLLDKPQHKVDIGINYENKKSGWRASLWGDYYINMLDSNTIANNGNYWISHMDPIQGGIGGPQFAEGGKQTYKKRPLDYGIFLFRKI